VLPVLSLVSLVSLPSRLSLLSLAAKELQVHCQSDPGGASISPHYAVRYVCCDQGLTGGVSRIAIMLLLKGRNWCTARDR